MKAGYLIWLPAFAVAAGLGYWLASTASPPHATGKLSTDVLKIAVTPTQNPEALPKFRRANRGALGNMDRGAEDPNATENQRVIFFNDSEAMANFLSRIGDKIHLLGRMDALHALHIEFSRYDDLAALLGTDEQESFIFPVNTPPLPNASAQPSAIPLGNHLLTWLGITGEYPDWGNGVKIAVLDTGVMPHDAFRNAIQAINLVPLPADPSAQNPHGTAVASLIVGDLSATPGVAPNADLISVRIADDNGQSNSFLLAKGIIAASDAGANLINISMGSFGDSAVVKRAIEYAREKGALIIAAAGNYGIDQVSYPAANDGVIAVGAVDAFNNHLDFSNSGPAIDLAAPGYGIDTAWSTGLAASVSGTSFSAPIITGAIAAVMTQTDNQNLSASQAYQLLASTLNDGGAAGNDAELGAGMPDLGRVLNRNTPGIYDAAVASHRVLPPDASNPYGQIEILVQNRGTETLINTSIEVTTGGSTVMRNLTSLAPNAVQTTRIPISRPSTNDTSNKFNVESKVILSGNLKDAKPSNDRRAETYVVSPP